MVITYYRDKTLIKFQKFFQHDRKSIAEPLCTHNFNLSHLIKKKKKN